MITTAIRLEPPHVAHEAQDLHLRAILDQACRYLSHQPTCDRKRQGARCTCGLVKAEAQLHELYLDAALAQRAAAIADRDRADPSEAGCAL